MSLFAQHPLRHTLSDEIHARPPTPLQTPELVTYLAFLHHDGSAERERPHLEALADQLGLATPDAASPHMTLDAGTFRLKWERHNEFSSYTFFRRIAPGDSSAQVMARAQDAVGKLPVQLDWTKTPDEPSAVSSTTSDAWKTLAGLAADESRAPVVPGLVTAGTDSRYRHLGRGDGDADCARDAADRHDHVQRERVRHLPDFALSTVPCC